MNTDTLIRSLATNLTPVSRHAVGKRIFAGLTLGSLVTLGLVAGGLGLRADLPRALSGFPFWMKWFYTISMAAGAMVLVARLARPEPVRLRRFWPLALPVGIMAILVAIELAGTPTSRWLEIWLGKTWRTCPWTILGLSIPIFAGLLWAFRRLAPTRLRAAGAAAGLASGACAATLYCLHCPETSAAFLLTWYSLGLGLAATAGALVGERLLGW